MFVNTTLRMSFENSSLTTGHVAANNSNQDCVEEAESAIEVTAKAMAYIFIILVSFLGNIFLVVVIYKNRQLRRSINYFVLNMAVSDLFNPLTIMPVKIVEIISGSESWKVDSPWLLGNILCKLSFFLTDVSLVVSIESLLLISMDRLVAVVFPLKAKLTTSKVRLTSILCTWIVAIAVHTPYFYTFRLFPYENKTYCYSYWGPAFDHVKTHRRYITATFITFILVPVGVLAIVYGTIAWTIKRKNKKTKEKLSCRQNQRDQQLRQIVRMSVAIIIAFVICMIPQLVVIFIRVFLWNWKIPAICAFRTVIPFISNFMLHSWSAVNPCICFIFSKNYRDGLMKFFHSDRLSQRASNLGGNHRMQTMTSSTRNNSCPMHLTSV